MWSQFGANSSVHLQNLTRRNLNLKITRTFTSPSTFQETGDPGGGHHERLHFGGKILTMMLITHRMTRNESNLFPATTFCACSEVSRSEVMKNAKSSSSLDRRCRCKIFFRVGPKSGSAFTFSGDGPRRVTNSSPIELIKK